MSTNEDRLFSGRERSVVVATLLLALALVLGPRVAKAMNPPARRDTTVLETYQRGLLASMPAHARSRLRALHLVERRSATPAGLAYVAADAAVRWYAAAGLTAQECHADAVRLLSLTPVTDSPTALAALGALRTVLHTVERAPIRDRAAVVRLLAALRSAQVALEEALQADPAASATAIEPPGPAPLQLPPDALLPALSALEHARRAAHHASDTAAQAMAAGANEGRILDACVKSLSDMSSEPGDA